MRWLPLLILTYGLLVAQTSLVQLAGFSAGAAGRVQPDLLALTATFVAMFARSGPDAMLAGMALGLAADLASGAAIGVMPVTYALAGGAVYRVRDALFRERAGARIALTLVFCLIAHGLWVTIQTLLAWRAMTWGDYGRVLLQAVLVSAYTAALAWPGQWLLSKAESLLFVGAPAGRSRR